MRPENGLRVAAYGGPLLSVDKTIVDGVVFDEDSEVLVAHVRPRAKERGRCGVCRRRSPGYDFGEGRRRWRTLDLGTIRAYLEADAPRVVCGVHGVVVAAVPWARHGAGQYRNFDDTVAWLAAACSKTAVTALMRVGWRSVRSIVRRVCANIDEVVDRFAQVRRIRYR